MDFEKEDRKVEVPYLEILDEDEGAIMFRFNEGVRPIPRKGLFVNEKTKIVTMSLFKADLNNLAWIKQ